MPTEEQHSWLQTALGVVGDLTQRAEDAASSDAQTADSAASSATDAAAPVQTQDDTAASAIAQTAENTVSDAVASVAGTVSEIGQAASDAVSTVVGAIEDTASSLLQQTAGAGQSDAGSGDAGASDAGVVEAGAADGGVDAGGSSPCGETPTFTTSSPVPVDVLADSVSEFNNKMNAALGGNPHMQPKFGWNFEFDQRGLVSKANLTVDTQIVRPRWSGGRPSDTERALIVKAVELIKAHEERHRDIAKDSMNIAVCATHGKTEAAATKALNDAFKKMDAAQAALDAREGQMSIVLDGNGQPSDVLLVGVKSP